MVLTRRAAKASKSIVGFLPNEILTSVMLDASNPDLLALCRTSRLFRNIATPLLYRTIYLDALPQIKLFLRTMKQRSGLSLSRYVRDVSITDADLDEEFALNLSPHLIKALSSVLSQLCHLEHLDLLLDEEFPELLQNAHFPNLLTFRYNIQRPHTASLFSSFLNRHQTITDLTFTRSERLEHLDPILLPNLTIYNGSSASIFSVDLWSSSVKQVCLLWYDDEPDVEAPLHRLGKMASPETFFGIFDTLEELAILGSVAKNLPRVQSVKLRRSASVAPPISHQDALEITEHLKKFEALSALELPAIDKRMERDSEEDRKTIELWGEACKTLSSVILHGKRWRLVGGEWGASK
ncbi:hypothetical protein MVEN_02209000 [Mycena venus]|uniref:F-box domain-containing protein n=1 Tax=Mycena venus TaxID=2733690 RepID=A0A8H6X7S0_9AGAR|nr:hypothetical protein MVEN_02209000 [Mycena venus]